MRAAIVNNALVYVLQCRSLAAVRKAWPQTIGPRQHVSAQARSGDVGKPSPEQLAFVALAGLFYWSRGI